MLGPLLLSLALSLLLMIGPRTVETPATAPAEQLEGRALVEALHAGGFVLGLDIEEGEAVIVRPDGNGGFTVVARVLAERWDQLDTSP